MAKIAVTAGKRAAIKPAASGVKATGKELLLVENDDNSCTLMGTDAYGNAVDIRDFAEVVITSSDDDVIVADEPDDSLTFRLRGLATSDPAEPVKITFLVTWEDGTIEDAEFELPCHVTRRELPRGDAEGVRFVIVPDAPVVRRGTMRGAVPLSPSPPGTTGGLSREPQQQGEPYGPTPTINAPFEGPSPIRPNEPKPVVPELPM